MQVLVDYIWIENFNFRYYQYEIYLAVMINLIMFYNLGSVLSVKTADNFAPNHIHNFVGICIERTNEGLYTSFTLRNVIDKTGEFF